MVTPRRFTVTSTREAVLVTADNLAEVAAWCGGKAERNEQYPEASGVRFPEDTSHCERGCEGMAFVGYVLVKHGGGFYDVAAEEFERHSARWEEQT